MTSNLPPEITDQMIEASFGLHGEPIESLIEFQEDFIKKEASKWGSASINLNNIKEVLTNFGENGEIETAALYIIYAFGHKCGKEDKEQLDKDSKLIRDIIDGGDHLKYLYTHEIVNDNGDILADEVV